MTGFTYSFQILRIDGVASQDGSSKSWNIMTSYTRERENEKENENCMRSYHNFLQKCKDPV